VTSPKTPASVVTLWRPVGQAELDLVAASGFRAFPPRLEGQPIFYPVLNEEYATQIARDWNTKHGATGYVTRFRVRADVVHRYEIHRVGDVVHEELWVPADELAAFNAAIVGVIEIVSAYRGDPPARVL
jgi:hypothetical protein